MTFIDDDFMLDTEQAKALYHDYAKDLPIIDYHCHLPPEQVARTLSSTTFTKFGWRAITTSGAPCAPTACRNTTAPATPAIGKSFKSGRKPCPTHCATPCTTGLTLSCANLLALPTAYSARKPPKVFGMSVMKNSPRRSSSRAD